MQFLPASCLFVPLGPNILPSTMFSDTLILCSSLNVGQQVSHPHKISGKLQFSFPSQKNEDIFIKISVCDGSGWMRIRLLVQKQNLSTLSSVTESDSHNAERLKSCPTLTLLSNPCLLLPIPDQLVPASLMERSMSQLTDWPGRCFASFLLPYTCYEIVYQNSNKILHIKLTSNPCA